ncbi:ribosomal protein S16 [Colletotrichum sojae]|uniref:Ribosomal protein S16 n=1 Tax=Colletotrichum sojae TaxID=2175907 RepID=A0A8H6ISC5_9PEZI|nr:ribosomal protein S16 [Colletotrichum sojae]
MVVRIRLARFGRVNQPFYNIVVTQARTARNSKPMEVIGTYDPIPKQDPYDNSGKLHKDIRLDSLRARYWIGVGAQPSDTVWRLLSMVRSAPYTNPASLRESCKCKDLVGILEPKYRPNGTLNTATAAKSLKQPVSS